MYNLRLRYTSLVCFVGLLAGLLWLIDVSSIDELEGAALKASNTTGDATTEDRPGNATATNRALANTKDDRPDSRENSQKRSVISVRYAPPGGLGGGHYTGLVDRRGRPHGRGAIEFDTGERYEGDWEHGRPLDSKMKMPSEVSDREKRNAERDKDQSIYTKWVGAYNANTEKNVTSYRGRGSFDNLVVVTSSNYEYRDLLYNWECHARRHGLKWVVVSMDQLIHEELGPERSILAEGINITDHAGKFRSKSFNKITCGKFRAVLDILESGHEVLFSDPDNVLLMDPLRDGGFGGVGGMIASNQFDLLYSVNGRTNVIKSKAKSMLDNGLEVNHKEHKLMINTGFYYAYPSPGMKAWISDTIDWCNRPGNKLDDQSIFWEKILTNFIRKGKSEGQSSFNETQHCSREAWFESKETKMIRKRSARTLNYCHMDPLKYRVGYGTVNKTEQDVVAYHANYVSGARAKRQKLERDVSPSAWILSKDGGC